MFHENFWASWVIFLVYFFILCCQESTKTLCGSLFTSLFNGDYFPLISITAAATLEGTATYSAGVMVKVFATLPNIEYRADKRTLRRNIAIRICHLISLPKKQFYIIENKYQRQNESYYQANDAQHKCIEH